MYGLYWRSLRFDCCFFFLFRLFSFSPFAPSHSIRGCVHMSALPECNAICWYGSHGAKVGKFQIDCERGGIPDTAYIMHTNVKHGSNNSGSSPHTHTHEHTHQTDSFSWSRYTENTATATATAKLGPIYIIFYYLHLRHGLLLAVDVHIGAVSAATIVALIINVRPAVVIAVCISISLQISLDFNAMSNLISKPMSDMKEIAVPQHVDEGHLTSP